MTRALALALVLSVAPMGTLAAQETRIERATGLPVKVQLDSMPLGALATMLMRDVMRVPYVISSEVLGDRRSVSVNLVMPRTEVPVRVVRFLRSQGLTVEISGGTVYVGKGNLAANSLPSAFAPSGNPLAPPVEQAAPALSYAPPSPSAGDPAASTLPDEPRRIAIIRPAHRGVAELAEAVTALFPGLDVSARATTRPEGASIGAVFDPDALAIGGTKPEVSLAVALVKGLDKPRPQVEVRAVVFEVRQTETRASALSLIASVAGLDVSAGAPPVPGGQMLRLATGGFSAVLSATRTDGRFKVVAEPSLVSLSGSEATINAGAQVPTLGAVTFTDQGDPIRSVVYRDSGISLTVKPVVRAGEIELSVSQERSSFGRTTTGVDESPTLNRAAATAQIALQSGEAVMLAGLSEKSESNARDGFLGGLLSGRSRDKSDAQLVLMLQAELAPERSAVQTSVTFIDADPEPGTDDA